MIIYHLTVGFSLLSIC